MLKYKFGSTYGYLCTSISSVTRIGDLSKYMFVISTSISFVTPTGDPNKYKFAISTNMCISLSYEFMKNPDICYCIFVLLYAYCT